MSLKSQCQITFAYYILILLIHIHITNACDSSCDIYLSNTDFDEGTLRIKRSGTYCLTENIKFNPYPSSTSNPNTKFGWFPTNNKKYKGCTTLTGGAYSLGFFAAITIETNDVEINLCEFEIAQSQEFNIQQRWFNVIEIAKAPFESGQGPTDFGALDSVRNIYIHNGAIGLSSHNAIHSNSAINVRLDNLKLYDFEVGGIQFNGANGIKMKNIDIGPSNDNVKPTAYYSNAKFVSFAMRFLLDAVSYNPKKKFIKYADGRRVSLQSVYDNLITSIDIAFRYFLNINTKKDIHSDLYQTSIDLYYNKFGLPDGSAMYGILLNSYGWAIFGLGQERNNAGDGENIVIKNVKIRDLKLHTNEIPQIYFDECDDTYTNKQTFIKGPFGDTMDIRPMVQREYRDVIDDGGDITKLKYIGNPLDDARIALALFGAEYDLQYGSVALDNTDFFSWVLDEYKGVSLETLPSCASFVCNGDIMFHQTKGIMGIRADLIDNLEINNIEIRKLINKSPLNSFACGAYHGPHDGGHPTQIEGFGGLTTSVKGMCIYGGDVAFEGTNIISNLKSNYGDVVGVHVFHDAMVFFDESEIRINNINACKALREKDINILMKKGKYPYPNDCFECNILEDPIDGEDILLDPNPPHGVDELFCIDINDKHIHLPISRTKHEPRKKKLYYNNDVKYRNLNWDPQHRWDHKKK